MSQPQSQPEMLRTSCNWSPKALPGRICQRLRGAGATHMPVHVLQPQYLRLQRQVPTLSCGIGKAGPGTGRSMASGPLAAGPPRAAGAPAAHRGLSPAAEAICSLPSLPDLWAWAGQQYGDAPALVDKHRKPSTALTFSQLHEAILAFAAGLNALGVRHGERYAATLAGQHSHLNTLARPPPRQFSPADVSSSSAEPSQKRHALMGSSCLLGTCPLVSWPALMIQGRPLAWHCSPSCRVALFAESSGRWLVADAGIMSAGAVNAVRASLSFMAPWPASQADFLRALLHLASGYPVQSTGFCKGTRCPLCSRAGAGRGQHQHRRAALHPGELRGVRAGGAGCAHPGAPAPRDVGVRSTWAVCTAGHPPSQLG